MVAQQTLNLKVEGSTPSPRTNMACRNCGTPIAAKRIFCSKACAARFNNINVNRHKKHDWAEVNRAYHEDGLSLRGLLKKYGICYESFKKAAALGKILRKEKTSKVDRVLGGSGENHSRGGLKRRLIKGSIVKNECSECGNPPEWNEKKLTMILDHINGVNNDNRVENLRLLCPNCNSQTATFSGRNIKRKIQGSNP